MHHRLTDKQADEMLNEIKTGLRCIRIKSQTYFLKFPSSELMSEVHLYEKELMTKYEGVLPTKKELPNYFKGKRNDDVPLDLDFLVRREKKLVKTIEHYESQGLNLEDETIRYYSKQLTECRSDLLKVRKDRAKDHQALQVRDAALEQCLDVKVNRAVMCYYIEKCVYARNREGDLVPYFRNAQFKNQNECFAKIYELFNPFMAFLTTYNDKDFRALARHQIVMNLFKISNKTNTPFFAGATSEYSQLQLGLLSWCDYYHSIFTNVGSPEQYIIEDDELFDKWLEKKLSETKSDKGQKNNSNINTDEKVDRFIFREPTRAADHRHVKAR